MSKFQKRIAIITLIISAISAIVIPIAMKLVPDKKIIEVENGFMFEQRIIGGGTNGRRISKTITIE